MERAVVESSLVRSAGHDVLREEMEVEFADGRVVRYLGVKREEWEGFMGAESKGSYLMREIRKHTYEVVKEKGS